MKILLTVGTRPNFIKIEPIIRAIKETDIEYYLVHTGQHYDWNMSQSFFEGLTIPEPDVNLEMCSTEYAAVGEMMSLFADILRRQNPDITIVVGDVDSTLACALVVVKEKRGKLAHIEAGCRSFDRTMPEEINRILTDQLSDYCFCNINGDRINLINEGVKAEKIFVTGNVMADTLLHYLPYTGNIYAPKSLFVLATFHRQSNVDNKKNLSSILSALIGLSERIPVVVPLHPRTRKRIMDFGYGNCLTPTKDIVFTEPMSYLKFIKYLRNARLVLTDSGGAQVEAAILGTACLTMRDNTEHRFTLGTNTNTLVGSDKNTILHQAYEVLNNPKPIPFTNNLLGGNAAERIVDILKEGK